MGVASYNRSDTFVEEMIAAFKDKMSDLEEEDIDSVVTIRDAAGSQRTQNDQVRELINAGCNVLCVIWWTGLIRLRSSILPDEKVLCRSSSSTESLWRRICSSGQDVLRGRGR